MTSPMPDHDLLQAQVEALLRHGTEPEHLAAVRRRLGLDVPPTRVVEELTRQARLPLETQPDVVPTGPPNESTSVATVLVCGRGMPQRLADTWGFGGPLWLRLRGGPLPPGPAVAIVGTRRPTLDGLRLAGRIANDLAGHGFTVVSGMARGIDQAAHRGALKGRGPTVGVLGTGHDIDYPAASGQLRQAVGDSGGVVSEYAPSRGVRRPTQFLHRNRILAGLADAVVVIEAGARSGALSTANLCNDIGRPVLVVPSSPSNTAAIGALGLLADGAIPVRDAADVMGLFGTEIQMSVPPTSASVADPPVDARTAAVLSLTGPTPASPSALANATGLSTRDVLVALSTLEEAGRVTRGSGGVVRIR